jgi:hypothetical protein
MKSMTQKGNMMEQSRAGFHYTLLDSQNAAFLAGKSNRVASASDWSVVISGAALGAVIGFIFVLSLLSLIAAIVSGSVSNPGNRVIFTLILGAGTVFIFYQVINPLRIIRADRRLSAEGQVVQGEVTNVESQWVSRARTTVWRVSYCFQTPHGQKVTGITGLSVPSNVPVPRYGTPLAILYVDENLHKAL